MTEPEITCPKCHERIPLTESLAAPMVEAARRKFQEQLSAKDAEMATRESALRKVVAAEEARKARDSVAQDLAQKTLEAKEMQQTLRERDAKLAEAQKAQAEAIRAQRQFEDATRELDLTVEKRVAETVAGARDQGRREGEEGLKIKLSEAEQKVLSMQKTIEDLNRKSEQGSQQLQGEALEAALEAQLRERFRNDLLEPVAKGEVGGDLLHRVRSPNGQMHGTILWESKNTKNWSDAWLPKLRDDLRAAKADIAIIVSTALPKGIDTFEHVDGVWVTSPRTVVPVAMVLRQMIVEVATVRQALVGQQDKMAMVYEYLVGPRFKQRVQAVVEAFTGMQEDLDTEKRVITKQWSKRSEQIDRVMQSTVGMYGDLQGIAGRTLPEIEGMDIAMLEGPKKE